MLKNRFRLYTKKIKKIAYTRSVATVLLTILSFTFFSQFVSAQNTYVITDGDQVTVHTSFNSNYNDVLEELGVSIGAGDIVISATGENGVDEIRIKRSQLITVNCDSISTTLGSYGDTVGTILESLNITLSDLDTVSYSLFDQTFDGMVIDVIRGSLNTETETREIPYETIRIANLDMPEGTETVVQQGIPGIKTCYYEVYSENNLERSRALTAEVTNQNPTNEIIEYGTRQIADNMVFESDTMIEQYTRQPNTLQYSPISEITPSDDGVSGTITTASGDVIAYAKILSCQATAYSTEGSSWKTTASGTTARVGAIAVDPSVIPLGTELYVVSNDGTCIYGYCVAEDTGGAIKGNIIDLYFDTVNECLSFGRRQCTVYVLGS